ncbi:MAG TPA: DUF962 domain-containing protein [Burkholderiales bacterium]|nr:DUF962 domain-containing protein [Burkholderiales bacterium]
MGENTAAPGKAHARAFGRFADFYPFYLSQHTDRTCRRLHFAGTTLGLLAALSAFSTLNFWWLLAGLAAVMGDWVMWKDMLTGRIRF